MTQYRKYPGSAYQVSFSSTAVSSGMSLFPFKSGANTRVIIEEIFVNALSSNTGTALFQLYRGSTSAISTAALASLVTLDGWTGAASAGSAAQTPTTAFSSTSATLVDQRGLEDGFHYRYRGETDFILAPSQRIDLVVSGLSSTSWAGVMKIREIGKNPIS